MLKQDQSVNPTFGGLNPGAPPSALHILNNGPRKCDKDGNFNFLGQDDGALIGDENRNQVRPRALGLLGRALPPSANHYGPGPLSPLSRIPSWSPLEPLPEIESGEDTGGRVPPDGAEEGKIDEDMMRASDEENEQTTEELVKGKDQPDEEEEEALGWDDSDEEFEFSYKSGSSSPFSIRNGDMAGPDAVLACVFVGGPNSKNRDMQMTQEGKQNQSENKADVHHSLAVDTSSDSDSDPCSELPDLMKAVWTLQDHERFKAQEMKKHHIQLTMYRRLALIRWVRTLQGRVQEQQNRLQSSFDIILTHRKELLRMGTTAATPAASQ
ncbi:uncharacterized protein LOC113584951 isoform X2 [Electrophorus electricus]|uniref:Uncharacterized protein n=2 Tax=Electrophorus electricus TaxID=8005 RepID=A0AAY5EST9_ELEEL|nr:uncharacterized protein LOC113584951 isoform X2 [Electrophorus electricus]XP_026878008.2 uncharacterized protein LOC113584951 isoform X2 [Electrophorus electricus]